MVKCLIQELKSKIKCLWINGLIILLVGLGFFQIHNFMLIFLINPEYSKMDVLHMIKIGLNVPVTKILKSTHTHSLSNHVTGPLSLKRYLFSHSWHYLNVLLIYLCLQCGMYLSQSKKILHLGNAKNLELCGEEVHLEHILMIFFVQLFPGNLKMWISINFKDLNLSIFVNILMIVMPNLVFIQTVHLRVVEKQKNS